MSEASPTFHFVGGKGGVGKTTCAAALALASASGGRRVLVVSTDPAPSLGDAFGVPLSSTPRSPVPDRPNLSASELDASNAFRRWLRARRPVIEAIAVQGTWLDEHDVARLLRLSLPGIDELAALFDIARLADSDRYDHVVIDTAPTGHTLRMLALPDTLAGVANLLDTMWDRHRAVEAALRGRLTRGAEEALIEELAETSGRLSRLLRDPARTQVSWVTLPESVAVAEANDAVAALEGSGIAVTRFIINRATPPPPTPCGHCAARLRFERTSIAELQRDLPVLVVAARDREPQGISALSGIARDLRRPADPRDRPARPLTWRAAPGGPRLHAADLIDPGTALLLVAGKGGVGKSTTSAALAIALAERWPDRPIELISTDPAHSLLDVLGQHGPDVTRAAGMPRNVRVEELDASASQARLVARYHGAIDDAFERIQGGSADFTQDRLAVERLLDLAPPGIDELTAILEVSERFLSGPRHSGVTVMDTAPTGHALRLLETPGVVHHWVRTLMSILLKYRDVTGLGPFGSMLVDLSRQITRLRDALADPSRTQVLIVTRAAELPRLETRRLLDRLRRMHLSTPVVLVNAFGRGTCRRCLRAAAAQRRELRALAASFERHAPPALLVAPAWVPAPRGAVELASWASTWSRMEGRH